MFITSEIYEMYETNREERSAALAGTRMLIVEEMFDSLVDALIEAGAMPHNAAAAMLDHLAERFIAHSSGMTDTNWACDPDELLDQAARLKIQVARRTAASVVDLRSAIQPQKPASIRRGL